MKTKWQLFDVAAVTTGSLDAQLTPYFTFESEPAVTGTAVDSSAFGINGGIQNAPQIAWGAGVVSSSLGIQRCFATALTVLALRSCCRRIAFVFPCDTRC